MRMQASLAAVSGVLGLIAAWLTYDWRWIVGSALISANWPYTLLGIIPTNNNCMRQNAEIVAALEKKCNASK